VADGSNAVLRTWQQAALERFEQAAGDFLLVATPGAGKTRFALAAYQSSGNSNLIVVVPTNHLRNQWAAAASEFGIDLDSRVKNEYRAIPRDMDGAAVTYASVASDPAVWAKLASHDTFVVLDEVHHAGTALTWGEGILTAFGNADRRLLLSGTPFRHDDKYIPFVRYESDGNGRERCHADYEYGYGAALQGRVVRPIQFPVVDGSVRYERAGQVYEHESLGQLADDELAAALRTAFDPDKQWIPSVFEHANRDLSARRKHTPDAAGLVLAPDKRTARHYARIMEGICGDHVPVATSDEPEASRTIQSFNVGKAPWLVAVRMVSEGVDIKRLEVGVYASTYKTELFFRQAAGRFVRMRGDNDRAVATLYIPKIEPLVKHASLIEKEAEAISMKTREDEDGTAREVNGDSAGPRVDSFTPLGAGAGVHTETIYGEAYSTEQIKAFRSNYDLDETIPETSVVKMMRNFGTAGSTHEGANPTPIAMIKTDRKKAKKGEIQSLAARLARKRGIEIRVIHNWLNQSCQERSITLATEQTLDYRLKLLTEELNGPAKS
jgi:superfamily II DNA or RNA helicase